MHGERIGPVSASRRVRLASREAHATVRQVRARSRRRARPTRQGGRGSARRLHRGRRCPTPTSPPSPSDMIVAPRRERRRKRPSTIAARCASRSSRRSCEPVSHASQPQSGNQAMQVAGVADAQGHASVGDRADGAAREDERERARGTRDDRLGAREHRARRRRPAHGRRADVGEPEADEGAAPGVRACADDPVALRIREARVRVGRGGATSTRIGPRIEPARGLAERRLDRVEHVSHHRHGAIVQARPGSEADRSASRPAPTAPVDGLALPPWLTTHGGTGAAT